MKQFLKTPMEYLRGRREESEHAEKQLGINMVDLMMWLVIAALILAAAIQGIGYYQKAAYLYHVKNDVMGGATRVLSVSGNEHNGKVDREVVKEGLEITTRTDMVILEAGVAANGQPLIRGTHPDLPGREVIYLFDGYGEFDPGINVVEEGDIDVTESNVVGGPGSDMDGDGIIDNMDADNDGIPNDEDDDMDNDGTPNEADSDKDGDGKPDDSDGDGIPNGTDDDVDGDGIPNISDSDADGDGIPNIEDTDIDGDGRLNDNDTDPEGDGTLVDTDGDGIANIEDDDVDGDGLPNTSDDDIDGDGKLNSEDGDIDNNGASNTVWDEFELISDKQASGEVTTVVNDDGSTTTWNYTPDEGAEFSHPHEPIAPHVLGSPFLDILSLDNVEPRKMRVTVGTNGRMSNSTGAVGGHFNAYMHADLICTNNRTGEIVRRAGDSGTTLDGLYLVVTGRPGFNTGTLYFNCARGETLQSVTVRPHTYAEWSDNYWGGYSFNFTKNQIIHWERGGEAAA